MWIALSIRGLGAGPDPRRRNDATVATVAVHGRDGVQCDDDDGV
jgi:hypothetical protein